MAEVSSNLKAYCDRVPEENQWKLDKQIDFEHGGTETHIGAIAEVVDEWEGPVAEALELKRADIAAIRNKYPDDLRLQTREALHYWQEKKGLDATYRNLISVFLKAGKTSFAEAVCKVLSVEKPKTTFILSVSNTGGLSLEACTVTQSSTGTQDTVPKKDANVSEQERLLLEVNEDKIRKSFAQFMRKVLCILKEMDVDIDEFVAFAQPLFPPTVCFPETEKISAIFRSITSNHLWSYSHYTPLKSIAEEFAKDDTQQLIESYERELVGFYATTKLANYIALCQDKVADPDVPLAPNPAKYDSEYFQKLTIKIGRRVTDETLQYVADIWKAVAKFFALPLLTALLDRVVEGSLIISWYIPQLYAKQIHVNCVEGEATAFFQAHQIIEVKIENECVYKWNSETTLNLDNTKLTLLAACEAGDLDKVLKLLQTISDFDFSQYNNTPLIAAAGNAPIEVVQVLLLYSFDVNERNKDGVTALMVASINGRTDIVELLIKHNADVNARAEDGWTALMVASLKGRTDVVELLLKHNADVNARAEDGVTALMTASQEGRTDTVELLIKHNAYVNARTEDGGTALMAASIKGRTDIVKLLIKHNADVNAKAEDGWTALMVASQEGRTDIVELLIKHNAKVNARAEDGLTALMVASEEGRADVVELLIKHNADVNARMENGGTALILASQEGRTDVVELLIKHNADVNARTENGVTALMAASLNVRTDVVEILIKHNADVNARAKNGVTALMVASLNVRTDVVELLIKHNADVNARAENGLTALIVASLNVRTDIVELLIKHNADVNARAEDGLTALMVASEEGRTDVVELLIKHNADVNARMENGFTALTHATQEGNFDIVKTLLEAGADPNIAENETNWTPIFFASKDGNMEIVQLLVEHGANVEHKDKNAITAIDTARTYNHTEVNDLFMAISMSKETSVLSEETTSATPQHSEEDIRKHVLSTGKRLQKLFEKQNLMKLFSSMKITDILLPERARKRRLKAEGSYQATSGMHGDQLSEEDNI